MRILLLCPERLAHQNPAGIGIRFLEFARAIVSEGHQVTMLSADGGEVEGCRSVKASSETVARETRRHDAAVVQGHLANELFAHGARIPTAVDLYDPFVIENLHYFSSLGERVFFNDHSTLMRSLHEGDLFLCASEQQRLFYLGALLAAGRLNPVSYDEDPSISNLLAIVPFGVPPLKGVASRDLESPAVLFGGIYDWYEPLMAIDAVAIARKIMPAISLTFSRHPNAESTPQSKYAEALSYVEERGYQSFISFQDWTSYEKRSRFYDRFAAALLTFRPSLETDLAMRTRVFDYLWAAVPVITSSAPGTDSILRKYDAGIVVESQNARDYAEALTGILTRPQEYQAKVRGTQAYAADHQWPELLQPLLRWCSNPKIDQTRTRSGLTERRSIIGDLKKALRG